MSESKHVCDESGCYLVYNTPKKKETKKDVQYFDRIEKGMEVAFNCEGNPEKEEVLIEGVASGEKYILDGKRFVQVILNDANKGEYLDIPFDSIAWVNTGNRYPSSIYKKLLENKDYKIIK